ncbi:MAG: GNAT family N-acetyltransferase [Deltaproteobacteria bacterium]|nr:GNAT family N-acetyltransferase [Deltaproteobacteria bacterium]
MVDSMGEATPHTHIKEMDVLEALWDHPTAYIQFAAVDAAIAGMAVCFMNYSTFRAAPFLNVHDLAVLPACRGMGVGAALLHGVILHALQKKCAKITLEVRDDNTVARSLYSKLGFVSCTPSMEYLARDLSRFT